MVYQGRAGISLRRSSVFTAALLLFPILSFAAPPTGPSFFLRRGVIVDSTRSAVYVPKPNGTLESIDLASGRTQWASDLAALPLGVDDGLVVAQVEEKPATERLLVAVLDAARGTKVSEAAIALPAGVRGLVSDVKGRRFQATAERDGATFLISWFYYETVIPSAMTKREQLPVRLYAGSARIQAESGRILNADGGLVTDVPGRWKRHGAPPEAPWQTGNVSAHTEGGRGGPLTLKRTETGSGRPLPEQALSKAAITSVASSDQRHVLASERVGNGGPDDPEYRWSIFATDTAEKATELHRDISASPFFVFGDSLIVSSPAHGYTRGQLIVEEPLELHAVRLTSGVPKWEVELRDLEYRGKVPPAR